MSRPTIACCMPVHNDLRFLRCTLPYEMKWADQIVILDMASTDGTKEYCEMFLRDGDVYSRRDENTCPKLGFGEAMQAAVNLASTDWSYYGAADQMIEWPLWRIVHRVLEETPGDVIEVQTRNIPRPAAADDAWPSPEAFERYLIRTQPQWRPETHRRIIRRNAGIEAKGYIHEEPYRGEVNVWNEIKDKHEAPRLNMLHFEGWLNSDLRNWRYSWMILNAIKNPELQKYTNRWWYDVHYPENKEAIHERARLYEEYVARTGDR